jgi:hypothetical protein
MTAMDMIVLLLVGAILLLAVAGITRDGLHAQQRLHLVSPRRGCPRPLNPGFRLRERPRPSAR